MFRQHPNSHVITQSGSVISEISIETSVYKKNSIIIYFSESADPKAVRDIQTKLKEISGDDACWHPIYCVINGSKSRQVVDKLFQGQLISAGDRADIEEDVRKTETNLGYQKKTTHSVEKSQEEIIEELISPYLEDILAISADHRKVFTLLQYAFSRNYQWELSDIIKLIKSCGKDNDECKETLECINHLKRICWEEGNLESTYERLGEKVPSLAKQRGSVANACLKALNGKFQLSIKDRFFYAVEIIMMTCVTQRHIYAAHTKEFLDNILNGEAEDRDIFFAFTYLGGFNNVVYNALLKANLNKEERQSLIDSMESKALLDAICCYFPSHKPERVARETFNARVIAILDSSEESYLSRQISYQTHCSLFATSNTSNSSYLKCEGDDSLKVKMSYQSNN